MAISRDLRAFGGVPGQTRRFLQSFRFVLRSLRLVFWAGTSDFSPPCADPLGLWVGLSSPIRVVKRKLLEFGFTLYGGGWRPAPLSAMKILSWNCRRVGNPATVRELKQLLVANGPDIVFLCETKIHSNGFHRIRTICRMEGCLAVDSEGKTGGLALLWKEGVNVSVQNYSKYHIDSLVSMDDGEQFRFTGFYGQTDPSLRQQSWDMLRRVKSTVNEGWIMGSDFNAILNNSEKEGGRRKPKSLMDDFCDVLEELSLIDVKTCNGWFTWTNNREGTRLVKERLDRFVISDMFMEKMSFLTSQIVRQSKSDHEAILMDTNRSKPRDKSVNHRAWFRYDICWAQEQEAKDIITSVWSNEECNALEKMELIRVKLGQWQYQRYRRMKYKIKGLEKEISKLMDGPTNERSMSLLMRARGKLGHLYDVEEKYWALRARSQWLKEGDRNTRYFHIRASGSRKKNSIERLKDEHGEWHDDKEEICYIAWNYFNDLFKTSINLDTDSDLHYVPVCIDEDVNRRLTGEFTDEEILRAFKQMDPRKASGIDGLSGSFFKDHWPVVGEDVLKMCHDILKGNKSAGCINETLIVLIPKIKIPCEMTNFRPISLCRVIYKIISKTLVNQLKEALPLCISQKQSVFVPNRMIHDNVLVAHELVHYLGSSKNGPNKGYVVKLDMSKAYDRVEWSFLKKVLKKMGFSSIWINKIMNCVCTVRFRVKCNTTLSDIIIPERGLRQGDPLSPYLFLFCMDALSRMLTYVQETNQIKGIRASKDGPRINHLFFAHDALLFVRNKRSEVEVFTKILESFERMSGQRINLDKSMVYFSPNTPITQRTTLSGLLKMKVVANLNGYLGLPIPIGKKKSAAFQSILDRAANRIESWFKRLLLKGGKEIFIKSVLQSIPTYGFFVFFVPNGVLEELQSMICRVWQVWRLISCRDTLCFRVLSAKYFPDGDVFHSKQIDKPSFTWQSIAKAASLLLGGPNIKIPILHYGPEEYRVWFHNPLGFYSTKSAYSWLTLKHLGFGPHRVFWKLTWKLQTLPKIKIFCWRLGHDILPTYENISGIRREVNSNCPRCGTVMETLLHAMKDCPKARADVARTLDKNAFSDFITVLWNIWNSRNNKVFCDVEEEARVTWERAAVLSRDFRIFNFLEKLMIPKPTIEKGWKNPGQGVVKINFDATTMGRKMSLGLVARDHDGFVLGGRACVLEKKVQAEWLSFKRWKKA
ncbi:hypothetical protein CXB51_019034 [Gossypium anomalum]|uniref:Reverse transcriptase domain-containing protein n=1 Tax=Gossypium anomalum TaxID=47600 RepID=A0A8J6CV42_9ROSI|nr:hypothetical protein CXB51_019034 [Gossypium anomalum]